MEFTRPIETLHRDITRPLYETLISHRLEDHELRTADGCRPAPAPRLDVPSARLGMILISVLQRFDGSAMMLER